MEESNEYQEPKVSLLLLLHDRYVMTVYCLENLLSKIGDNDYELLILDNGSKDDRAYKFACRIKAEEQERMLKNADKLSPEAKELLLASIDQYTKIKVFRNEENKGIAAGYNKLIKEAKGEYICFVPNDILVSDNWLKDLMFYNSQIDKSGFTSIHCEGDKGSFGPLLNHEDTFTGVWKCKNNITSGITLINREALGFVGSFDESLGLYGREREQMAIRLGLAGYHNYYVPGQYSIHIGRETNDVSEYRKMKDIEIKKSAPRFEESLREMKKEKNYYIPLP